MQAIPVSLSLNPPQSENVPVADFEAAIGAVEERLGLSGQPRAIVFHEKNGRRHAHAVWSRIDVAQMKAVQLSFSHNRLREVPKDLFREHGWRLPDGLRDRENRDPRNFTLAEWQQAKRHGKDARAIKRVFQEAWQVSDNRNAFASALEEKGSSLARGDRRGFVALDVHGEIYSIPKFTAQKTKAVREKLGDAKHLPSADQAKEHIARTMQPALSRWRTELETENKLRSAQRRKDLTKLVARQRNERRHAAQYEQVAQDVDDVARV